MKRVKTDDGSISDAVEEEGVGKCNERCLFIWISIAKGIVERTRVVE